MNPAPAQVDHKAPGDNRPITITGPRANVDRAVAMVRSVMDSEAPGAPGDVTRSLECPPGIVGRIIGRGGETIRSLQQASGAHIMVDQNFPEGHPRQITVTGKGGGGRQVRGMGHGS